MKLNRLQGTDSVVYGNPAYYPEEYDFSTAYPASVERVQAGNVTFRSHPTSRYLFPIPCASWWAPTSSSHRSAYSFCPHRSSRIPPRLSISPCRRSTSTRCRSGSSCDEAAPRASWRPSPFPAPSRARSAGVLGVSSPSTARTRPPPPSSWTRSSAWTRPASRFTRGASSPRSLPTCLVRTAVLEWPLHGAVVAAGDTIRPRAVVTGERHGPVPCRLLYGWRRHLDRGGVHGGGRPVEIAMRGPLPTRRLGEHRLQFVVESPQPLAANPISFLCAPPPNGVEASQARPVRAPTSSSPDGAPEAPRLPDLAGG